MHVNTYILCGVYQPDIADVMDGEEPLTRQVSIALGGFEDIITSRHPTARPYEIATRGLWHVDPFVHEVLNV